jgi:rhodanese-related sulfurtransferase
MKNYLIRSISSALKLGVILVMISVALLWGGGQVAALPGSGPAGLSPFAVLAETAVVTPPGEPARDLATTLDQFLQTIPPGYYGLRNVNVLKTRLKETDLVLIDVRETSEYILGHIDGALNIPLRTLVQNLEQVPKDKPVMLYCSSGYRTGMGVMALRLLGYDNVEGFPPSYNGWQKASTAK